jgi:predicted CopG family antitoxin
MAFVIIAVSEEMRENLKKIKHIERKASYSDAIQYLIDNQKTPEMKI